MWSAAVVGAVGLSGTAFMIYFLIGLLRETTGRIGDGSARLKVKREKLFRRIDWQVNQAIFRYHKRTGYYVPSWGKEDYAKVCASGLVVLGVHPVPDKLGMCPNQQRD